MKIIEIILIAIGLAMDAFAVSVCKGLSIKKIKISSLFIIASYFGIFQAVMPLIGFFLGMSFQSIVMSIAHWITFILLLLIGSNMIKDSIQNKNINVNEKIDIKSMILLGIATSLDALAVGITFSFFQVNILLNVLIIGLITFMLCVAGVWIGYKFGNKLKNKAQIVGGIILITIGIKVLIEHYLA